MVKGLAKILGIVVSLGMIGYAIAGTLYHIDKSKVSIEQYEKDKKEHEEYVAFTDVRFLEQHRRDLQQRIWDIKRSYPTTYHQMSEYLKLVDDLRKLDLKIKVFYQRKGG